MRYAIVSDIHANLQAWNAALIDIGSMGVEKLLCLGDVVGYGPNPREVLESVHARVHHMVLGNHDAALCGLLDDGHFNETARAVLLWQRDRLNRQAVDFLREQPLSIAGDRFRCTHANFAEPGGFDYVDDVESAQASFAAVAEPLLFLGHSHRPRLFVTGESGRVHSLEAQDFEVEPGKRYLVNVGAIGQPRDGDARSSYCIYDTTTGAVVYRRIPFDLDAFAAAIAEAHMPAGAAAFLKCDPRRASQPLREVTSFRPPGKREESLRGVADVHELKALTWKVRRWRMVSMLAVVLALGFAVAGGSVWLRSATRSIVIQAGEAGVIHAADHAPGANMLPVPDTTTGDNAPVPGWSLHLGDKRAQHIRVVRDSDGMAAFEIRSMSRRDDLRLRCGPIRVAPGMNLQLSGMVSKGSDFQGTICFAVPLDKDPASSEPTMDQFVVKEPNQASGEWLRAQKTFELPAQSDSICFEIRGRFTGSVRVGECSLARR